MTSTKTTLHFSFPSGFTILIILKGRVLFKEREYLLLRAYVPGIEIMEITQKNNINNPGLIISYYPSKYQKILYDDNNVIIYDDWSKEIPVYFFHLIYSISHDVLLKNGFYTVYSACVGKKDQWSLLLGHTGAGKTTVMLNLLYNYRFKMFSSNKTILKFKKVFGLEAIEGTTTVTCKNSDYTKLKIIDNSTNFVNRIAYRLPDRYSISKNKVKIEAVSEILKDYPDFKNAEIFSKEADSEVSHQPKSLEETIEGAIKRAKNSFSNCNYSFGLESGLMKVPETKTGYMDVCVCSIYDGEHYNLGLSSAFEFPKKVIDLIFGRSMNDANQAFYNTGLTQDKKIGSSEGAIGMLTKGRVTRKDYTKQAIYMALIHLENSGLY